MSRFKCYYHLIKNKDTYLIYDYIKHILVKINEDIYEYFNMLLNTERISDADYYKIINNQHISLYIKTGLFLYSPDFIYVEPSSLERKIAYFSFPTVHNCNLRCKYCFADHGNNYKGNVKHLDKKLIKDIFEFMYSDFYKEYDGYRLDFVSGGEPLLNFEALQYAIEIAEEFYMRTGKKTNIFICTNGTVDNPDIWNFLNKYNINIGISIDGDREVHDAVRVYENGQGCYEGATRCNMKSIA